MEKERKGKREGRKEITFPFYTRWMITELKAS
jgi:hypothetical protein